MPLSLMHPLIVAALISSSTMPTLMALAHHPLLRFRPDSDIRDISGDQQGVVTYYLCSGDAQVE
jgi:hypothetical protein